MWGKDATQSFQPPHTFPGFKRKRFVASFDRVHLVTEPPVDSRDEQIGKVDATHWIEVERPLLGYSILGDPRGERLECLLVPFISLRALEGVG
eukprot:2022114-Prymnesium_polylepis.2